MSKLKSLLCKFCAWQVVLEEQDTEERQSLSLQRMINLYYGGNMTLLITSLFLALKLSHHKTKGQQQTSQFVWFAVFPEEIFITSPSTGVDLFSPLLFQYCQRYPASWLSCARIHKTFAQTAEVCSFEQLASLLISAF